MVAEKTGLIVDAYFSASKNRWIILKVECEAERAARGQL